MEIELIFKVTIGIIGLLTAVIVLKNQIAKNQEAAKQSSLKILEKMELVDKNQTIKIDKLIAAYTDLELKFSILQTNYEEIKKENAKLSEQFFEMQKHISVLLDIHKNPNVIERLSVKLRKNIDYLAKETNREVRRTLVNALGAVLPLFSKMLADDFKGLDADILYEDIKREAVAVQPKINIKALDLKINKDIFIHKLSNLIKSDIRNFCNNVVNNSNELQNGERISSFFEECITLISTVSTKTVEYYENINIKSV